MTNDRAPITNPPRFCEIHGTALVDKTVELRNGFDPFTGIERPRIPHVTRECRDCLYVWVLSGDYWVRP